MKYRRYVMRFIDVRPGETRVALLSFFILMLASAGYTILETARDSLLVMRLSQSDFGFAYIAVAACALPAASAVAHVSRRWDPRFVLLGLLLLAAMAALVFTGLPMRKRVVVIGFYVFAGLVSSSVFPQFWVLVGTALTVGQSRRLIGPIAAAGVFGAVVGASTAAAAVSWLPLRGLVAMAAALLVSGAGVTFFMPNLVARRAQPTARGAMPPLATSMNAFQSEPFLLRVALLVAATTATALVIDYFFKSTVARTIPSADRGAFIARYYAVMNVIALAVQLFVGSAIVRNLGVSTAMILTPLFSFVGGAAALAAGSFTAPVFVLRAADGSLRSSINRLTTELVYLPVSASGRERAKPFIDGAIARLVQALTAGGLLGLSKAHALSPRVFSAIIVALSFSWLVAAVTMRRHYLGQLRHTVVPELADASPLELDLASAELVVEHLGSDDSKVVVAAMNTLVRRGHERLISALILRHSDSEVLRRALEIFAVGPKTRSDWHTLAQELINHADDGVRIGAASALAAQGKLDFERLAEDSAPSVRGYAALHAALGGSEQKNLVDDPRVAAALSDAASAAGLLAAVADAEPSPRVSRVLLAIADRGGGPYSAAMAELLARATIRHDAVAMVPRLLDRIGQWEGREAIRNALVALGEPAFDQISAAIDDQAIPRRIRVHLPQTLGRFGTPAAARKLLECVEHESDGLVRYKALRALGRIVTDYRIAVDLAQIERSLHANLVTYFRLLALRVGLGEAPADAPLARLSTFRLLAGLLDDKIRQALERAFRLLKIAHPKEDIHRVYLACISSDKRERANAAEFLDALLRRRSEQSLRELVRIVSDDLSPRLQVMRAARKLGFAPLQSPEEAIQAALADADIKVAALAALYAVATGGDRLIASVEKAQEKRPSLAPATQGIFHDALPVGLPARA